jgi:DNA-binding SARP family transcriptional activator/Tfp pilus assembly protein PilF
MRFRILGPLEVHDIDGKPVRLRAPKQRALLAILLLHAGQPVSPGRLETVLWPGRPPRSAAGVVRTYVSGLRSALRLGESGVVPRLTKEPAGYRLTLAPGDLDLTMFDELSARGREVLRDGDPAQAARLLSEALALWRGEPAEDIALDGDYSAALAGLAERHLAAGEAWADAQLALGSGADLIARLRALAAEQPLRERLHSQLMLALYQAGRKAEALEEFRGLRTRVSGELGIEPSAPVQKLHRQILSDDPALSPVAAPASVAAPPPQPQPQLPRPPPRQLPHDTGDFTGRETQLRAMAALLARTDLTAPVVAVLTGTAGAGKTALAVHFAHQVAESFPDGQLFADLRGHAAAAPVPPAEALRRFLRALGMKDVPADMDEAAAAYRSLLAGKRLLILLDDAATADQIRPLLPGSPGCLVLLTSRSRLPGLVARDSAAPVAVGALTRSEGVVLLKKILGTRRVETEPEAATSIVSRCAYLPLALRVAAERAAHRPGLSLSALAAELADEQRRLDVLTTGEDERATVRSVFSWSYRGLAPNAARVFRLLGLHPGPEVSVPAVAALADSAAPDVARKLEELASAHLTEEKAPGRYRCHDLLWAYATERADDEETPPDRLAALRRVLTWYLCTADTANRRIGPTRRRVPLEHVGLIKPLDFATYDAALEWCDAELPNLAAAVRRAAEADLTDIAWKIPAAMSDYFRLRRPWGDWISCNETGLAAAQRAGDIRGQAWSVNDLGSAYLDLGRFADAADWYEKALVLIRQTDDQHDEGAVLNNLAAVYWELCRTDDALDCFRQSLVLARRTGNRQGECLALDNLGEACRRTGQPGRAIDYHRQARVIAVQIGDRQEEGQALRNLGEAYQMLRLPERARKCYLRALEVHRQASDRQGEAETRRKLGDLLHQGGQVADAREHWHHALAIFEAADDPQASDLRRLLQV